MKGPFAILRLRKLHLLMLRGFSGPLMAGYAVSLFVLVLQFLAQQRNKLFGKGLPAQVILEIMGYAGLSLSVVALVLGVLLASLMTLGRLGENYELTALKSSGISLWRIVYPLIMFVGVLTAIALLMTSYVEPWAKLKMWRRLYDADQTRPEFALRPGVFNNLIPGYVLRISDRKPDGSMLYGMRIYDHAKDEHVGNIVIVADSARMMSEDSLLYLHLELYHGIRYEDAMDRRQGKPLWGPMRPFSYIAFDTLQYNIDMSAFLPSTTEDSLFLSHPYMRTTGQLIQDVDSLMPRGPNDLARFTAFLDNQLHFYQFLDSLPRYGVGPAVVPVYDTLAKRTRQELFSLAAREARTAKTNLTSLHESSTASMELMRRYAIELHLKFSLPISLLLFVFVGAPLGAIIRKGGFGAPIVVAISFFVLYYVLMSYGKKVAAEGALPVWLGVWLPVWVILPMALYLSFQSATDSRLFDLSAWRLALRRLYPKK